MRHFFATLVIAALSLMGLLIAGGALWYLAVWFRASVRSLADDVRVSLIAPDGRVIYDTAGQSLPNHADREEVESVLKDGKPRTIVRESSTLNRQMIYHARKVGKLIVRFAVPRANVDAARRHVRIGLLAACAVGALAIAILFFALRRTARRLDHLAAQRDAQRRLVIELRQLESFRKDFISNVTHELKTPLTGILGAVDILSDDTAAPTSADRTELLTVLPGSSKGPRVERGSASPSSSTSRCSMMALSPSSPPPAPARPSPSPSSPGQTSPSFLERVRSVVRVLFLMWMSLQSERRCSAYADFGVFRSG